MTLPDIPAAERTPLVEMLLVVIEQQQQSIATLERRVNVLEAEVRRLKALPLAYNASVTSRHAVPAPLGDVRDALERANVVTPANCATTCCTDPFTDTQCRTFVR